MEAEKEVPKATQPSIPVETLDHATQKKHAAMLSRLTHFHQTRLEQSVAQSAAVADSPAFESVTAFSNRFSKSRRSIEADLQRYRALAADPQTVGSLKPELKKVAVSIANVDRLVAENSYFLPACKVHSSLKAISDLKEALEIANNGLWLRKKFSFHKQIFQGGSQPFG